MLMLTSLVSILEWRWKYTGDTSMQRFPNAYYFQVSFVVKRLGMASLILKGCITVALCSLVSSPFGIEKRIRAPVPNLMMTIA